MKPINDTATKDAKATCELKQRLFYETNCLTQIQVFVAEGTFTASTDGHVAFWKSSSKLQIDGRPHRHRIHQNSIKAMTVIDLISYDKLIITGGDDNAIGLTLVHASTKHQPRFATLLIPRAHAAAVTATCVASAHHFASSTQIRFLSTSNDQRVKLWSVSVELDQMFASDAMSAVTVERVKDIGTSVADAAAMEIVPAPTPLPKIDSEITSTQERPVADNGLEGIQVLVVGVGMEVLYFDE